MDRTGLYIMVFIILLSTCSMMGDIRDLKSQLKSINQTLMEK